MSFTSVGFLFIFFPFTFFSYYIILKINSKVADYVLLLFNLGFYSWAGIADVKFLIAFIVFIYFSGRIAFFLGSYETTDRRVELYKKQILGMILVALLAILFFYKYYNFVIDVFAPDFSIEFTRLNLIAPLGISYLIFSAISYLMDI